MAIHKDRDAKAELNRRSQVCEILAGTGISRRKSIPKRTEPDVGHYFGRARPLLTVGFTWESGRASGYCALYSGLEDRRVSFNTYARIFGIPCWNHTSLCGFAGRRLSCSANGM
jgi:hypothetical protein